MKSKRVMSIGMMLIGTLMAMAGELAVAGERAAAREMAAAGEMVMGNNSYNAGTGAAFSYTATAGGTLTVSYPAEVLLQNNTSVGYTFTNGADVNQWGAFYSDLATRKFEVLRGESYTLTLNGSLDIAGMVTFAVSFEASGKDEGPTMEYRTVTMTGASWSYMDATMLTLDVENSGYAILMTVPIGKPMEGALDFAKLRIYSPIIAVKSGEARTNYSLISGEGLQLAHVGNQLVLTGSAVGKNGNQQITFTLDIRGSYPEVAKKDNDMPVNALPEVAKYYPQAAVRYDDEQGEYVISGMNEGWKYEAQIVVRAEMSGSLPAAGTYEISDDFEAMNVCPGGLAGMSDLGLGVAGCCVFELKDGERQLPAWLMTTGVVKIEVSGNTLTATATAKNSYSVDVNIVMSTGKTIPTDTEATRETETGAHKVLREGKIYIIHNGQAYDMLGGQR